MAPARAAEAPARGVEEIIVTATKRETALQLTPLAISAVTGDTLDELNYRSFNDYLDRVPGLATVDGGTGRKRYLLRGVSAQDSNASQATVAQYIDEVPISNAGQQPDPRLVDVERVEVLRGPQGTLFGARSMAGAIRMVTRKPLLDRVQASAQGTISATRFGGVNGGVEALANAPLVEGKLGARVSGFYDFQDGYVDNVFAGGTYVANPAVLPPTVRPPFFPVTLPATNNPNYSTVESYGGRVSLRWLPSDRLTVDAFGLAQKSHLGAVPLYNVQATGDESRGLIASVSGQVGNDDRLAIASLTGSYDLGFATATAVGAYAYRTNNVLDGGNIAGPLAGFGAGSTNAFGGVDKSWTSELRLVSPAAGPFHWLVGGYSFLRISDRAIHQYIAFARLQLLDDRDHEKANEKSIFAEVSYDLTDRLEATGGLRYSWNTLTLSRFHIIPPAGSPLTAGPDPFHPGADDHAPTYKAELSYRASDAMFLYALASEGFRPSGYNGNSSPGSVIPLQFRADTLWNYEVGAKTRWLDNRLVMDGALYRIDWSNIQVISSAPTPQGLGVQPFTTNGSKAQIYGAELEVTARITPAFSVDLALNHLFKAELTADAPTGANGLTPRAGDPLPYDASWMFNLGGEYRTALTPTLQGFARLDWSYVDRRTTGLRPRLDNGAPNNGYNAFPAYSIVDLRFGVASGPWRATAFVQNLLDARPVIQQQNFAPLPVSTRNTRQPRTIGLTVRREL